MINQENEQITNNNNEENTNQNKNEDNVKANEQGDGNQNNTENNDQKNELYNEQNDQQENNQQNNEIDNEQQNNEAENNENLNNQENNNENQYDQENQNEGENQNLEQDNQNVENQDVVIQNEQENQNEQQQAGQDEPEIQNPLIQEWEENMKDFIPDEMLTFTVKEYQDEVFVEEVVAPTKLRGAYFVSYQTEEKINFYIKDSKKNTVFEKLDTREGIFIADAVEGDYQFIFSNSKGSEIKIITFALDVRNNTESHLKHEHLDPVDKILEHVIAGIKTYSNEQRFTAKRQQSQLESVMQAHNKLLTFSILENIIVVFASVWQIYYIKKILDNKRIV